ncbi:DUF2088 domain-containing protein [Puteibacter caeruleilacunae]|nr:DUF2088 domain-containing protein [Puteibacter caeruleilacunae]
MIYYSKGAVDYSFSDNELRDVLFQVFNRIQNKEKVLAIPPDFTRLNSYAGPITTMAWEYFGNQLTDILPALGTHNPMTDEQISKMFGPIPKALFRIHDWRNDVVTLGEVPADFVKDVSDKAVDFPWPVQVNKLLRDGGHDLILSIGQVVPHEVVGMANHNKNIFVGTGGAEGINKSHFVGAAYGMEKMMGRADTPVRKLFNYGSEYFGQELPILYILTVMGKGKDGNMHMRGLFIGDDQETFEQAAKLSLQVNFELLEHQLEKVVVYLDPEEFTSTWLGNKSIYRTRMAIADEGELIVLAPKLVEFGEDKDIDRLIRKYGYCGTPKTLQAVKDNEDLRNNLSAAAHLIHGSSEGRFNITYCTSPTQGNLTKEEIESVGFRWQDYNEMTKIYDPMKLNDGFNTLDNGEEIFYISNPALGLWAWKNRF